MKKMKHLQFFKRYIIIALAAFAVASCSKDSTPEPEPADPKILSFGFYAEDNEGNLFRDYFIENVTGSNIQIELPKDVDRSALVGRFTTTENSIVTVGGVPQQSGVTANNFSVPVDYIVTEKQVNARYTVTITNEADYVWTRVGAYTDFEVMDFKMAIHPSAHTPHFLFVHSNSDTDLRKAQAAKYDNASWQALGNALSSARAGTDLAMAFNEDGKLFVAFPDYSKEPSQAPVVHSYDGSSWSVLGGSPVFPAAVTYSTMAINPANNYPILVNHISDRNYTIPRRATVFSHFNGSSWNIDNRISGRDDALVAGIMKSKTVGDAVYLATYNSVSPNSYSIYKYQNSAWTTILDQFTEDGATGINLRDFDMDVDQDGNIYVASSDNASGAYKPRIKKYNAATQTWSQVGGLIEVDQPTSRYFDVSVAPNGVVHFYYRNEQGYPVVQAFNPETQDWNSPIVLESAATKSTFISIDFASDGTGYASFINEAGNIVLYKYDTPN